MEIRVQNGSVRRKRSIQRLIESQFEEQRHFVEPPRLETAVDAVLRDPNLGFILVARRDEEEDVVGMCYVSMMWALEHGGRACRLEELYVTPGERGQGVGKQLIRVAIRRARQEGCVAMDVEIDHSHARAENLYRREGFTSLTRSRWVRKLER